LVYFGRDALIVDYTPVLILLAPLIGAIVIGLLEGLLGRKAYQMSALAQFLGLGIACQVLYKVSAATASVITLPLFTSAINPLQFGLYIDRLAAVMMVLISVVGLIITLFSVRYMQQDRERARFHALISLTTFTLLTMVASDNLLMLFAFWQLLSWLIYLLSHHYAHAPTVTGAARAYSIFRIGDIAFLVGMVLTYHLYGTLHWEPLLTRVTEEQYLFSLWPGGGATLHATMVITLLIFIGVMSKSAQFPMNLWPPGVLYAPTPVSALQCAGNAGVFLLNRLAPLYGMSPTTLHIVFAVGLLTTLLGGSIMLTQNDIKKTLAHSTMGQMGYMVMASGLGAFGLAFFHLIAHTLFKATLFLNSGNVIHMARREPKRPPPSPRNMAGREQGFSALVWGTGCVITLILPLIILVAAHGAHDIPLIDSQGAIVFLFFIWVTSSQAILTLYRLRAIGSWKVAAIMFATLLGAMWTYLFAVEQFTHFLYPDTVQVTSFFAAAALPSLLFDLMVGATTLAIIIGWVLLYAKGGLSPISMPSRLHQLQARLYLLFINRLYLERLHAQLGHRLGRLAHWFNQNMVMQIFFILVGLFGLFGEFLPAAMRTSDFSASNVMLFLVAALLLPLFPLHGVYMTALTRVTGYGSALLALLMPIAGVYALSGLTIPVEMRGSVRFLALLSALYGAFTAMAPLQTERLLVAAGITLSSIFWWSFSYAGMVTPPALVYVICMGLTTGGLFLAWQIVVARYGRGNINRVGGLAWEMPCFAVALLLLVMAAMGLPPFGLFSGVMGMLLHHTMRISWDLPIIGLAWLLGTGFLLGLMQRILFGPRCAQIHYRDLSYGERMLLGSVLLLLLVMGVAPLGAFIR
jgi:NADH-quinone oxidoreductase subunit L